MVWPLTLKKTGLGDRGMVTADQVKNLNHGVRRPSKLSLIDKRQTAALKLLPSGSLQIQWRRIVFFFLQKKTKFAPLPFRAIKKNCPLPFHAIVCGDPEGNNFNTGVCHLSIRGSFDGQRTPAFRFFTQSASDHILVSRTAVF